MFTEEEFKSRRTSGRHHGGTKVKEEVRIQYSRVTADFNINYYHHEKINKKQYNQWLRSHTLEPDCLDLNPSFAIY